MSPGVERGYRSAQAVTRHHAKSFHLASILLVGERRRAAFALYAFCRRLDDAFDVDGGDRVAVLDQAREVISWTQGWTPAPLPPAGPWPADELHALADSVRRFSIPARPLFDLVEGMRMDLQGHTYRTFADLELYSYRVAGTVGLLIAHVLGFKDPSALDRAVDLGVAMQLTNILRDVREDAARGRVYLPADELARFDLGHRDVLEGVVPGTAAELRWRAFLRMQVGRARSYYARAALGVPLLMAGRWMVRAMASIYGAILGEIERRAYDVFSGRARVPTLRKLALLAASVVPARPHSQRNAARWAPPAPPC